MWLISELADREEESPASFASINDRFIEIMIQGDEMILSPASKPGKHMNEAARKLYDWSVVSFEL